jgi:hypothetical protein
MVVQCSHVGRFSRTSAGYPLSYGTRQQAPDTAAWRNTLVHGHKLPELPLNFESYCCRESEQDLYSNKLFGRTHDRANFFYRQFVDYYDVLKFQYLFVMNTLAKYCIILVRLAR